ncbi:MAG TPA: dTMP kinase [Phycisphaerales bacterium]|nr:dTMP kinase [Phycisphaerales bacterium]
MQGSGGAAVGMIGARERAWARKLAGRFVVFEGPDGSGKSTQLSRLAALCAQAGLTVLAARDPGGTPVGERVREILLDRALAGMGVTCECLLYMASRAELVEQRILPALARGELVLADRFVPSTLAYQGAAGGVPAAHISAVARLATHGLMPDLVVLFDVDEQTAGRRLSPLLDRMEAKGAAFHRAVRQGYLEQAEDDPGRYLVIDASASEEAVWGALQAALEERVDTLPAARHAGRAGARA